MSSQIPSVNPYRAILRREYPEPLIALLAFILGIWLWDHYFGKPAGYAPGTEQIALVKIDRDLRLADAMNEDSAWLKWLAGADNSENERKNALESLNRLTAGGQSSLQCLEALTIIQAVQQNQPVNSTLVQSMQGQMTSDFTETSNQLANHHGTWWHAKWIDDCELNMQPAAHWRHSFGEDSRQLRNRAIITRSAVWALALIGLFFIPRTLITLKRGLHAKSNGYGGAWPMPLGLIVFLVATLAWIGFTMTLEIGISTLPNLHPMGVILLDSAARLLPSLIAIGLIFRRPSHAFRVMGLRQPIALKTIIGLYSLLTLIDQAMRYVISSDSASTPGGGLNASEAGIWGLFFTLISACLLAPISEELLYRGVLFRSFWNRLGVLPAAILSSMIFAILHFYDGYGLASVGIFGMSCALLYAATGSLGSAIALHLLYNVTIKLPEWIVYHQPFG
ncbi:MAG: CPBP family intramembrane metalloprotease [Gloeobacteraceae cyanobacterium ES-bin-144]|nr:CPBP family intramembrane metalloprotease [Verrucomicrobiales bacterium]